RDRRDECRRNTAGMLRELAAVWHSEAQKTRDPATFALAGDLYKEYLRRFPVDRDTYLMHFYYGELLYTLGELDRTGKSHYYCDAAPIYTQVVRMDSRGPKLREAAYAAVVSWQSCLGEKDGPPETATDLTQRPIPDSAQRSGAPFIDGEQRLLDAMEA